MELLFIKAILDKNWYELWVKLGYEGLAWLLILFACFIDLKTGIQASRANGVFKTSSYGLRQTMKKFKDYMDVMLIALATDVVLSIFNTMSDKFSILAIFNVPIVTIIIFIYTMATELISVIENKKKSKGKPIYTPEAIDAIDDIAGVLGVDGISKLAEQVKKWKDNENKEEPKNEDSRS